MIYQKYTNPFSFRMTFAIHDRIFKLEIETAENQLLKLVSLEDLYFFYDRSLDKVSDSEADDAEPPDASVEDGSSNDDYLACSIYRLRSDASVDDTELVRRYEASSC